MSSIRLRKLSLADTANIVRWRNQPEVYQNLFTRQLITEVQHIAYYHKYIETGIIKQYIVESDIDGKTIDIGTTFLKNIDQVSHKAEFGIFIGESSARGRGLASAIVTVTLAVAFEELKLNKVYLTVLSSNESAIHAYQKSGFIQEGVLRQDFYDGREYVDVVMMGILRVDYEK